MAHRGPSTIRATHGIPGGTQATDPISRDDLLGLIRTLPDVVFRCEKGADGSMHFTFNEGRLAEEFHLTTKEVRGKPLEQLFPPEVAARLRPHFERAFAGESAEFVNELGGRFFRHYPQPVFGPDGRVVAVVGFITEVTRLVETEKQIQDLNVQIIGRLEEVRAANESLRAFGHMVSHDLRRPLTAIQNYRHVVSLTDGDHMTERGREALQRIAVAGERMQHLVEDMLAFAESGHAELACRDIDLGALAREIVDELHQAEPFRRHTLSLHGDLRAWADPRFARIALVNLLQNAWKFSTDRPEVLLDVGRTDDPERTYYVRDNGIGFDPAKSDRLFRLFERAHDDPAIKGSGIGLNTVERVVSRHGGRVWAQSAPGQGATFFFTLPPAKDA